MIAAYRGVYSSDLPLPDEALAAFFAAWAPAPNDVELVPLELAAGRILARDVRSAGEVPESPRSAMDGFAVRAGDLRSARPEQPCFLEVAGEARPGSRTTIAERTAVRVATGAPLPQGADAVVRIEDAFLDAHVVGFSRPVAVGTDVIAAGDDIAAGTLLARAGTPLNAALLGVLATLGEERAAVYRRPAVALLSTGDEVVPIAAAPRAGEVRDSNGVALSALLRSFGVGTITRTHVRDDLGALRRALAAALEAHDAVVLTGGSSVGARDFTTAALAARDPGVIVHGVRIKPGRPVILAASGSRPIIGLPGSPTAAMLALTALGAPVFAALCGRSGPAPCELGFAREPFSGKPGWVCYVPVRIDSAGGVRPVEHHRSSFVSSLVEADGYVRLGPEGAVSAGDPVQVHRLP